MKRNGAPGRDGLAAEMISKEVLSLVWYELFKLCWKEGMMPSIWKQSVVIPVLRREVEDHATQMISGAYPWFWCHIRH